MNPFIAAIKAEAINYVGYRNWVDGPTEEREYYMVTCRTRIECYAAAYRYGRNKLSRLA